MSFFDTMTTCLYTGHVFIFIHKTTMTKNTDYANKRKKPKNKKKWVRHHIKSAHDKTNQKLLAWVHEAELSLVLILGVVIAMTAWAFFLGFTIGSDHNGTREFIQEGIHNGTREFDNNSIHNGTREFESDSMHNGTREFDTWIHNGTREF